MNKAIKIKLHVLYINIFTLQKSILLLLLYKFYTLRIWLCLFDIKSLHKFILSLLLLINFCSVFWIYFIIFTCSNKIVLRNWKFNIIIKFIYNITTTCNAIFICWINCVNFPMWANEYDISKNRQSLIMVMWKQYSYYIWIVLI